MHWLTRQERLALICVCAALLCGSVLRYGARTWPAAARWLSGCDERRLYRPVDLNTSGELELMTVPGIGPQTARRIITHRERFGPYESLDDLARVSGIGPKKLKLFSRFLKVDGRKL